MVREGGGRGGKVVSNERVMNQWPTRRPNVEHELWTPMLYNSQRKISLFWPSSDSDKRQAHRNPREAPNAPMHTGKFVLRTEYPVGAS